MKYNYEGKSFFSFFAAQVGIFFKQVDQIQQKECGIPIRNWLKIFGLIYLFRSLVSLIKIVFIKKIFRQRNIFDIFRFTFVDGAIVLWHLYGNKLFYSQANDCASHSETLFLSIIMKLILI